MHDHHDHHAHDHHDHDDHHDHHGHDHHDHDDRHDHYDAEHGDGDPSALYPKDSFYYADNIELTTVGIDVGSSTSHLMFSRLHLQRLGQYLSSRYVVVERETLYRSPILLTPYTPDYAINARRLEDFVHGAYHEAGISPEQIDSGAIILTGEAVKRTNARAIADLFASQAGKFVCASAGPNLEAVMAAFGSGAVSRSRHPRRTILNVDVGGGTSKLALIRDGEVLETAAMNVGGRLVALDAERRINRIEPTIRPVADALGIELHLEQMLSVEDEQRLGRALADALMAVARREPLSMLTQRLLLTPALSSDGPVDAVTFSGGVSEYVYGREERDFGDLAHALADAIRQHIATGRLPYPLISTEEGIRATVMGASQFTVQVSGNTIAVSRPALLPIHNLQVLYPRLPEHEEIQPEELSDAIRKSFQRFDLEEGQQPVALAIDWNGPPRYRLLRNLAEGVVRGLPRSIEAGLPLVLVSNGDFGKLLGDILREDFDVRCDVLSIDSIQLKEFDYVDIGELMYPANVVPVVVKSLVFPEVHGPKAELRGEG